MSGILKYFIIEIMLARQCDDFNIKCRRDQPLFYSKQVKEFDSKLKEQLQKSECHTVILQDKVLKKEIHVLACIRIFKS